MNRLSLTGKRWSLPAHGEALNASHVLLRLLKDRGIAQDTKLVPPSVYPDMQKSVDRIRLAVEQKQRIGIFGDYDCDGVTAAAQLVRYFRRQGIKAFVRLPHRVRDGYGLKSHVAQEIIDTNVQLLITCDTGIASAKEVAMLMEQGIDVIITDHHSLQEEIPQAFACIHPSLCGHPLPHPSGSGVVFALICALEDGRWKEMDEDIALAMLGTVGDLVPLRGSNRTLVQLGLRAFDALESGPLYELRQRCIKQGTSTSSTDIAFCVAPRINAAGRMSEADIALSALLDGGDSIAQLDQLNEKRQDITRALLAHVVHEYENRELPPLVAEVSDEYPHGIVGLIAGKLTEHFGKPSLVAHTDGTTCTASLRSPACYNIAEGLGRASDLLISFGGHAQAAGCTFALEDFSALRDRLIEDVRTHVDVELLVPTIAIDAVLDAKDITKSFCEKLQLLEPFGQENAEPLFLFRNVSLQDVRSCGKDQTHLQARICGIKSIGFGLAHIGNSNEKFDIVGRIGIDEWNGNKQPQIFIQDLGIAVAKEKAHSHAPFYILD
ncbi:MAG: single-stranded-DNA-specific exonuclease RecJ [bacterium]|nr:single-stranded-DNA-specific exonuclease RecJ [bacterium]MDA1292153.1 single-stranded-DNA-specific exonuclease RecJ [bacterium]